MKREDIRVGEVYASGDAPPLLRKVVGEGAQYVAYQDQIDLDCVGYHAFRWHGKSRKYRSTGATLQCTRASFASWAKRVAMEAEKALLSSEEP